MALVRESGMPEETLWEGFFASGLLQRLGVRGTVADFCCGYGTFSIPAARLAERVLAFDISEEMVSRTRERAASLGLSNLTAERCDLEEGCPLQERSVDWVLLCNILHGERPELLLGEARRILRHGGNALLLHWLHGATPRGPPLAIRPRPEDLERLARAAGFTRLQRRDAVPWHYAIIAGR